MPNFELMMKPLDFAGPKPEEDEDNMDAEVPHPFLRNVSQGRRFAQLQKASDLLAKMPTREGEVLTFIIVGRFDVGDILAHMLATLGPVDHLRITTLSFARRNAEALKKWVDTGLVRRLSFLVSEFFKTHNADVYEDLRQFLAERHAAGHRMAAARSHCKVLTFEFANGDKFAMSGSANTRTCSSWENMELAKDVALSDWHSEWIDGLITKYVSA